MQKVIITKENDPNQGRIGLAEVVSEGNAVYIDFSPNPKLYGYNEIKVVSNVYTPDATHLAFNRMKERFHVWDLIREVRSIMGKEYVTDASITKRLRELRGDSEHIGKISYDYDTKMKKYKKL